MIAEELKPNIEEWCKNGKKRAVMVIAIEGKQENPETNKLECETSVVALGVKEMLVGAVKSILASDCVSAKIFDCAQASLELDKFCEK